MAANYSLITPAIPDFHHFLRDPRSLALVCFSAIILLRVPALAGRSPGLEIAGVSGERLSPANQRAGGRAAARLVVVFGRPDVHVALAVEIVELALDFVGWHWHVKRSVKAIALSGGNVGTPPCRHASKGIVHQRP